MEGVDGEKSQAGDDTQEAAPTENVVADNEEKEENKDDGDEDTVDEAAGEGGTQRSHPKRKRAWKRPKKKARLQTGASLTRPGQTIATRRVRQRMPRPRMRPLAEPRQTGEMMNLLVA